MIDRKNETEKIFVVELLKINQDIQNLVSNSLSVNNYEQLGYTQGGLTSHGGLTSVRATTSAI